MSGRYLGHLPPNDPLFWFLQNQIASECGAHLNGAGFRVFRLIESREVFLYEARSGNFRVVGKFFRPHRQRDWLMARRIGETEFNNLTWLRNMGFVGGAHGVARPLAFNPEIDNLLVVEYVQGESLDRIIEQAIFQGQDGRLYAKLTTLAHSLAKLHNATAGEWKVNFQETCDYMTGLLSSLIEKRGLGQEWTARFYRLREAWRSRDYMWGDVNVVVHGDATPSNFIFGSGREVKFIDLERMKWADRVFDLGRLAGELKHFFYRATGQPQAAEPYIGHFLWEYCCHFPDREAAFRSITRRVPFHMGLTLLRIARNGWVDKEYRWRLINEAHNILGAG